MQQNLRNAVARKSIRQVFSQLRQARQIALMPFIPAGYPSLEATTAILPALEAGGASLIEIGFPFSDPIADGPTIQAAFTEALKHGTKVHGILQAVAAARPLVSIPLVAMVSYSIVFRYGQRKFFADLSSAGFDAVIIPDLPPPEAQSVCALIRAAGLDTVLLVSPSSTPERRQQIVDLCSGFVYYLSIAGITGERSQLPPDLAANVQQVKQLTRTPVCVGFGVSQAQHIAQLKAVADGAIVGSAVVRRINEHAGETPQAIAASLEQYCRDLLAAV